VGEVSPTLGWVVLALVFLDEVLAVCVAWLWGLYIGSPLLMATAPVVVVLVWFFFASPKARFGGPVVRPVMKVLVFGLAAVGLWRIDLPALALVFLVFSVAINAFAQLPSIQRLAVQAG
jgi:hypothetical protein